VDALLKLVCKLALRYYGKWWRLADPRHPGSYQLRTGLGIHFGRKWSLNRYYGPPVDSPPHSHYWKCGSLVLRGAIRETWYAEDGKTVTGSQLLVPGNVVRRDAEQIHKIEQTGREGSWTLFWHGEATNVPHFFVEGRPVEFEISID
jgi:hypothetical protein